MAKQLIALVICSLMLAVAVQAHPGRKMQQLSNQLGSRATAAQAETGARINAAIDNNAKVKPGQARPKIATTASVRTPKPTSGTVTASIAAAPKTSHGGAQGGGAATASASATAAMINTAASGTKVTKPPATQPPKVTTTIATTSKTGQGAATSAGTSTAAQAATAAKIAQAAGGAKPPRP